MIIPAIALPGLLKRFAHKYATVALHPGYEHTTEAFSVVPYSSTESRALFGETSPWMFLDAVTEGFEACLRSLCHVHADGILVNEVAAQTGHADGKLGAYKDRVDYTTGDVVYVRVRYTPVNAHEPTSEP